MQFIVSRNELILQYVLIPKSLTDVSDLVINLYLLIFHDSATFTSFFLHLKLKSLVCLLILSFSSFIYVINMSTYINPFPKITDSQYQKENNYDVALEKN